MAHLQVNGVTLAYEVHGDGAPVVFVHEFAGSMKAWAMQVDDLAASYRTITYNCRGYPPSTVPEDEALYSQDQSIADLRGLMDELGIAGVVLVGLSMGGSIALNFAIRHPERVRGLVLAATGSGSDDKRTFIEQFGPLADRLEREGSGRFADEYLRGPTRLQLLRKNPSAWQKLRDELAAVPPRGLACTIRGTMLRRPAIYELEPDLRRLQIPTLVMIGDEDSPVLRVAGFLVAALPLAELMVFRQSGHTLNLEEPSRFNLAIREFLSRLGR